MTGPITFKDIFSGRKHFYILGILLLVNLLIRLMIYYNTTLFYFSDYGAYLKAVDKIAAGEKIYILSGNFYYTISYLGYFFKYVLGSIDYFFIFNCFLGTLTSLILYILVIKVTDRPAAGLLTVLIHTLYTEFMVFSSVFYTPVLMIFLLSLFVLLLYFYFTSSTYSSAVTSLVLLSIVFSLTFFFKPELLYLPWFMLVPLLIFAYKKEKPAAIKTLILICSLFTVHYSLSHSGLITQPPGNTISNTFVMFGHTDYGGDGGEGAFIYPENRDRYNSALQEYLKANKQTSIKNIDYNAFNRQEIKKFITQHPFRWVKLQFTKFFRTFGIVPESTSFKILYTGIFKGHLWVTAFFVVFSVAFMIILAILFFPFSRFHKCKQILPHSWINLSQSQTPFIIIFFMFFIYFIIATIFYGQYAERYRLSIFVLFIIPVLGFSIANYIKSQNTKLISLFKVGIILLFIIVWCFQTKMVISNRVRLLNVFESIRCQVGE